MPSNKKIFDKLISRVKIYLVIIAILLTIICINNVNFIMPSILFYALIVGYAYWSNQKRKEELSDINISYGFVLGNLCGQRSLIIL